MVFSTEKGVFLQTSTYVTPRTLKHVHEYESNWDKGDR